MNEWLSANSSWAVPCTCFLAGLFIGWLMGRRRQQNLKPVASAIRELAAAVRKHHDPPTTPAR